MTYNEARKRATINYQKKSLHRVPLDLKNEVYENVKKAAEHSGQSVNGYIKKALFDRMKSEGFLPEQPEATEE